MFEPGLSKEALSEMIGPDIRGKISKDAMEEILRDIERLEQLGQKYKIRFEPEQDRAPGQPPEHP